MSFKVLVIPEDPIHNGAILKPLALRMLEACGRLQARVTVLENPRAKGFEHAKSILRDDVFDRYAHFNLMLFLPDADGRDRSGIFADLERHARAKSVNLLCCAAQQEVEVWLLAGHADKLDRAWTEVRTDVSVKENVFEPFLRTYGDPRRAGGGRDLLMQETLKNYDGLLQRCPELRELQNRIREMFRT